MKQCTKCNKDYDDSWNICLNCNEKLVSTHPFIKENREKWARKIINDLYKKIGKDSKEVNQLFIPEKNFYLSHRDAIVIPQTMGTQLLKFLNMPSRNVIASFSGSLSSPGRVESSGNDYFIEIDNEYKNNPYCIGAIIAHEITHVYLFNKHISYINNDENELATDVASIILGLGLLILNGFTERVEHKSSFLSGEQTITQRKFFGYLKPEEIGYLTAYRILVCGFNKENAINSLEHPGMDYYRNGFSRANGEINNQNNLKKYRNYRKKLIKMNKALNEMSYNSGKDGFLFLGFDVQINSKVVMMCNKCFQKMRVPLQEKTTTVLCPTCNKKYEVKT